MVSCLSFGCLGFHFYYLFLTSFQEDREQRKAEVRARLEQAAAAKKKKGFMTPARKKKLRVRD